MYIKISDTGSVAEIQIIEPHKYIYILNWLHALYYMHDTGAPLWKHIFLRHCDDFSSGYFVGGKNVQVVMKIQSLFWSSNSSTDTLLELESNLLKQLTLRTERASFSLPHWTITMSPLLYMSMHTTKSCGWDQTLQVGGAYIWLAASTHIWTSNSEVKDIEYWR